MIHVDDSLMIILFLEKLKNPKIRSHPGAEEVT